MDAGEWERCRNAFHLLRHVHARNDARRFRLFNLACCRRVVTLTEDDRPRRYLDGLHGSLVGPWNPDVSPADEARHVRSLRSMAWEAWDEAATTVRQMRLQFDHGFAQAGLHGRAAEYLRERCRAFVQHREQIVRSHAVAHARRAAWCAENPTNETAWECRLAVRWRRVWVGEERSSAGDVRAEAAFQVHLVRDVWPNPYLPPPTLSDGCRRWRDGLLGAMAATIAAEGRWSDLPILADALEEAGCTDDRLLGHARRPVHADGCWLVELLRDG